MKRFIAIMFAAVIFSATAAQAQIIHVKSTTITTTKKEKPPKEKKPKPEKPPKEEKPKREWQVVPLKHGYRGFVDAKFWLDGYYPEGGLGFDLTTTHGYQFNDYLFTGVGIGLILQNASKGWNGIEVYPAAAWGLPLYAAVRGYITRTAVKPFAELRLGGMIALNNVYYYNSYFDKLSGLYSELAVGVEYKRLFAKIGFSYRDSCDHNMTHLGYSIGIGCTF